MTVQIRGTERGLAWGLEETLMHFLLCKIRTKSGKLSKMWRCPCGQDINTNAQTTFRSIKTVAFLFSPPCMLSKGWAGRLPCSVCFSFCKTAVQYIYIYYILLQKALKFISLNRIPFKKAQIIFFSYLGIHIFFTTLGTRISSSWVQITLLYAVVIYLITVFNFLNTKT